MKKQHWNIFAAVTISFSIGLALGVSHSSKQYNRDLDAVQAKYEKSKQALDNLWAIAVDKGIIERE